MKTIRRFLFSIIAPVLLAGAFSVPAAAQSNCPYIATNAVLTAQQWNFCFSSKQNSLGYVPVNRAGDVMLGKLTLPASTGTTAGLNLPQGNAPSSPNNGDVWTQITGVFARINGVTVGPFGSISSGSLAATPPISVTFPAGVATYALDKDSNFSTVANQLALATGGIAYPTSVTGGQKGSGTINLGGALYNNNVAPTGTGAFVLATSPSLVTPNIGAATGTSLAVTGGVTAGSTSFVGFTGRALIFSPADGYITLRNNAISDFSFLQFGGATAAFPAWKRNGANIELKLADDSAYTDMRLGTLAVDNLTANRLVATNGTKQLSNSITSANLLASITDPTGTGVAVFSTSPALTTPTIAGVTITGSFTATGLVTNAALANPATTVNGQTCTLGSTCTVQGSALGGTSLAASIVSSSLTSVGALSGGSATTGFTINASNVTWSGSVPGANVAAVANASGSPSATFGVMKCDGTTTTCAAGVVSAVGGSATDVSVGVTTVTGGTSGYVLYNNAGVLGNLQTTGSGNVVRATSPTLVTPVLGAATATSINGLTITSSTGTLTITNGKTASFSNSIVFAGTDGTTMTMPSVSATIPRTVASGAKALATGAISSGTCTSAQTDTATGTAATDAIIASFNADPTAVTGYIPSTSGMLAIIAYPTTNTVNFKVCNNTTGSITPGAVTINWRVVR